MQVNGSSLTIKKATGWGPKTSAKTGTMCVGFSGGETVVGTLEGKILRLKGGSITFGLEAHKACVNAIWSKKNGEGFLSGASDGLVIIWDSAFTKSQVIDLSKLKDIPIMNPRVRAVSMSPDGKKIVIGTRSSNIIEYSIVSGAAKCVNYGHFDKELWGLAPIPKSDEFVTCGEDFMVAKWNLKDRRAIRVKRIQFMATVCDVSSDGQLLAIGCKNGRVLIMNTGDFSSIKDFESGKKQISELKFSPDCKLLAVGSHDSRIRIYTTNGYKLYAQCTKNLSTVTHLDWSTNSQVIQSNSTSYEILFFTSNGSQVTSGGSTYKEEEWASYTCVIGWPVQGIWPAFSDGSDINALARSKEKNVLATADDFGTVKLFKYPCVQEKSAFQEFFGHSSHVTNVRFSDREDFVISTGGNDKCIIQWKYTGPSGGAQEEEEGGEVNLEGYIPSDLEATPQSEHLRTSDQPDAQKSKPSQPLMYGNFQIEEMDDGDQSLAVKPFLGEVKASVPRTYKEDPQGHLKPIGNLVLKHAFGFRCFDAKDSAKFGESSNTCIFITAALGVVQDITTLDQTFFNLHDEDLISMDVSPCKRFCATGSMPAKGRSKLLDIYVWDTQTKEKMAFLTGFHKGAIKHLKFSPSGNLLLSVGLDDNNSLAVYDWRNQRMICNSKVDRTPVFDCDWQNETTLAVVGKDMMKVFTISNGSCSGRKGAWGSNQKLALACCKFVGNVCFTGTWNGMIIPWNGTTCGKAIKAHANAVFCLHYDTKKQLLLSGGKDGMIYSWKVNGEFLTKVGEVFNYQKTYENSYGGIRAIDTHNDGSILVGTRTAELIKINIDGTHLPFMNAHFDGELWGLACHPTEPLYVTAGGDRSIRIFDIASKFITQMYFCDDDVRAVDWSSDAQYIVAASVKGEIMLFNTELEKLSSVFSNFTKKGGDQWIEEIKFSPDSRLVAFGSHGGYSPVEILSIQNNKLEKFAEVKVGFTSALLHLDWSVDSNSIVTNSQAAELKFLNVQAKQQMRSSDARDIDWATWTCKFGFPVQGIWPGVDYTEVNTVCRSANGKVLATGEDSQKVKLFRYPCVKEKSQYKSYTAHASHVTRVRFMLKDNILVTTGGNDKTSLVWMTDFGEETAKASLISSERESPAEHIDEEDILGFSKKIQNEVVEQGDQSMPEDKPKLISPLGFEIQEQEQGDEFMAVLPWKGAIRPPTNFTKPAGLDKKPKISLTLEHCHGYRARDKRNNIFYVNNDDLCFYAAAVGIVHSVRSNSQMFYNEHRDDILSMAVHPNRKVVATGELGRRPQISIWSSSDCQRVHKILGGVEKSVDNLAFSESGRYLLASCMDDDHKIFIYDSEKDYSLVASEKSGREFILGMVWVNDNTFITVGLKHYKQWSFTGSSMKGTKGSFKSDNLLVSVAKAANNDLICGSAKGEMQIWQGASNVSVKKDAHKQMLDAIAVGKQNIYTGGKDATVKIWDFSYNQVGSIDVYAVAPETLNGHVRAIALDEKNGKMTIGLYSSEIYEFTIPSAGQQPSGSISVVKGHFARNHKWTNEVWGLSLGVDQDTYFTCSDDGYLRKWSVSQRKCLTCLDLNVDAKGKPADPDPKTKDLQDSCKTRSIDIHPYGLAVVGTYDGTVKIVNVKETPMKFMGQFKHRSRWIQDLKFSPDGTKLAVGAHDAWLNFYEIPSFKLIGKAKKHSSAITHLDWSTNSQYIHSTCQACELLFFDTKGNQLTRGASSLCDEDWATWTAVFGWPVQGIWQEYMDASDINAVDRSHKTFDNSYRLLACGNDMSKITIYRYPCLTKGAEFVEGSGHASHVTNVKFNSTDTYLFSTGGEDQTVMQWRISGN